ncbi:acetyl-CoA carboxylase biotin carboxylase subunit [Nonlabens sp. Ci31]|jgi:propionyl-CoA carboxylase alpha chain|uniref:acetyl-CoA carboxylase biotin carboxylase subunit n=1 Tax=Nonlabens sp. Ci31 TaxID=2608253 RepID=UPI001464A078|nr:acetyl-CoA carboxylase biotin carboxylase subunit [Nonlabens sp. Ci31]QJP34726.1 acetyl-CoA carboxylase biotin carboxylase subunit [Nonlabens sp. Ci31]
MKKILIANRGEIAIRVMKTAQKMGIKTVAVYSEADRGAPHVRFANEAVLLGPAPSSESYLVMEKVIQAAKDTGADAIHPGYGFLSENAKFAQLVEDAGIVFIGPKPHAIQVMGNKLAAKEAVRDYNIPMVPGIEEAITDVALAEKVALEIGFPILIKASAGGGGKGMRIVENIQELPEQMERAISEAKAAFGDGSVFIEKYVGSPRHIEIQILADTHGNIVHLFERECSVQRRHQKVVEEAPSVVLTPEIRKTMGEAAIKVAKACDYVGAGTVEFLLDENKKFYFLEMNTRLQVEHPVTELISGIDLVEQQIKVARGEKLAFTQEDLSITGHALEVRVYAEDPLENFTPSIGKLSVYKLPTGEGIRVDNGFEEGMEVPIYYDPMLSKLITYGKNREEAIQLMIKAIDHYKVEGIATTLPFGKFVCEHEAFRSGNFDTHFVKNYYSPDQLKKQYTEERKIAALVGLQLYLKNQKTVKAPLKISSNWDKRNK